MPDRPNAAERDRVPAGPDRGRRTAAIGLLAAATVALLLSLAVATGSHRLDGFDGALTDLTRSWADPLGWPVDVAHGIGRVTAPRWSSLLAVVVVAVLFALRYRAAAAFLAISALAGVALTEGVKRAMGRARPPGAGQFEPDLDKSFPSGHSSAGIYLYLAIGLILLQIGRAREVHWLVVLGRTLIVIGPMIGLTRLVLGVHWPSDILGGWAFGSTAVLAGALLLWDPLGRGWPRAPAGAALDVDGRVECLNRPDGDRAQAKDRPDADTPIGWVGGDEGPYSGRPGPP